jgi:signal transduction histidine kinase
VPTIAEAQDGPVDHRSPPGSATPVEHVGGAPGRADALSRAEAAMERAARAEVRAREAMQRVHEREPLLREVASALSASLLAPEVTDLVMRSGIDWMSPPRIAVREADAAARRMVLEVTLGTAEDDGVGGLVRQPAALDTARRARAYEQERRLRATLETVVRQMPVGVVVMDADTQIARVVNEHARSLMGGDQGWHIGRLDAVTASHPDGRPFELHEWPLAAALRGHTVQDTEVLLSTAETGIRVLLVSAAPVTDGSDSVIAAVQVMVDITVRREAAVANDAFMGVLSHELRTPVTSLLAGSEMLQAGEDRLEPRDRATLLEGLVEEASRLRDLVDNLLVLARLDHGPAGAHTEPVLLQRLLPGVIARESRRFPDLHVQIGGLPADLPAVHADVGHLQIILVNLLSNAGKYGRPGGTVRVDAEHVRETVAVRVMDDGPGLPAELLPRLFRLFARGADADQRASGAGIGLYASYRLATAMGARMYGRNRPGGGAEFGILLAVDREPLVADDHDETARAAVEADA